MLLYELVKKNFKIILRNPLTIILLFLLPIILIFLIGISFSSNSFQDISFGLINSNESLFKLGDGVKFQHYNGTLLDARKKCIYDLDRGEIKICIEIKLEKSPRGEVIGGNVIYYIDNTNHLLSGIVEGSLDRYIEIKENEFSKEYLEIIFFEANNTLSFMKKASIYLNEIEENLNFIEKEIKVIQSLVPNYNGSEINLSEIIIIRNDLEEISSLIESIELKEEVFFETMDNIDSNLEFIESKLISDLDESLSLINSTLNLLPENTPDKIKNNLVSIQEILLSMDDLKNNLEDIKTEINKSTIDIKNINENYLNDENLNSTFNLIKAESNSVEEGKDSINYLNNKLNISLNLTIEKKLEISLLKTDLNEMIGFLENYSSIKSDQIIDPIKVIKNYRFIGISKIHQFSPIIIIMVLLFVGILLSNTIVSLEINSKAYFRNNLSPIPQGEYVLGLFLTSLFIIIFEITILFLFLEYYFNIEILSKFWPLLLVVIHILTPFILLGIFYAYYFDNPQVSIILSLFSSIGLFLLSNILVPIELMPVYFSNIIQYSPVVIGIELFREIFFYSTIDFNYNNFLFLYLYSFILIGLIQYSHHKRKKKNL